MIVTYYDERYALASDLVQNNFQPGKTDPFLSQHRTVQFYTGALFWFSFWCFFFFIFETEHFRKVGRDNLGYYTCYLILDVNKCLEISRRVHETMVCHLNIWKYYDYDTCSCCTTNNITCSNLQVALFLLLLFTLFRSSVTQLFQPRFLDNNALMLSFQYKVQTSFSLIFLNCNGVFVFA